MKKILLLTICFLLLFPISNLAKDLESINETPKDLENGKIIDTRILDSKASTFKSIKPEYSSFDSIVAPKSPAYMYGTVKINDVIGSTEYGPVSMADKTFAELSIFEQALITVATNVPKVDKYTKYGAEIWSWAKAVKSDLDYIVDTTKPIKHENDYTYRNFYHNLFVYDYKNTWYDAGYSNSRYYYLWGTEWYSKNDGSIDRVIWNKSENLSEPTDVLAAINYKNYSFLENQAYNEWTHYGKYYENWNTGW